MDSRLRITAVVSEREFSEELSFRERGPRVKGRVVLVAHSQIVAA